MGGETMRSRQMLALLVLPVLTGFVFSAVGQQPAAATQQALAAFLPKSGEISGWKIQHQRNFLRP